MVQTLTRRRWLWAVVAVLGIGVLAVSFGRPILWAVLAETPPGDSLTVDEAHQAAIEGRILLIDIRRPEEWANTGTGEGAMPLDMRRPDFIEALDQLAAGDRSQPIALICARGVRSSRLANELAAAGFTQIINVPEGMLGSASGPGWIARGLPLEGG